MSALTDQMTALGTLIAQKNAPTDLTAINAAITALQEHDASEDAEVADAIAGLQALATAAGVKAADTTSAASSGTGASS